MSSCGESDFLDWTHIWIRKNIVVYYNSNKGSNFNMKNKIITAAFLLVFLSSFPLIAWEYIGPGDSTEICNLYCFGNGHILAFDGDDDDHQFLLFRSRDYGNNWDTISITGDPYLLNRTCEKQIFFYNERLYAGVVGMGLFFSEDSGNTWIKDSLIRCGGANAYSFVTKDSIMLVGTYCRFSRSTDYGKTWKNDIFIPNLQHNIGAVFCLMAFRDVVYAGTQYGIFASKDWGLTWEKRGVNLTGPGGTIFSFGRIDTVMFYSSASAIWRSYDLLQNGENWIYSFDTRYIAKLHVIDSSVIYVSDYNQDSATFFYSTDTCKTFTSFSVTSHDVSEYYHIRSDEKYIYVMNRKGLYRNLKTNDPTDINDSKHIIHTSTRQPKISIKNRILSFTFKQPSSIEISLFRLNGQRVFYYNNNMQFHRNVNIDLRKNSVTPGAYIIHLKTPYTKMSTVVATE
jgi:hypothetical protein